MINYVRYQREVVLCFTESNRARWRKARHRQRIRFQRQLNFCFRSKLPNGNIYANAPCRWNRFQSLSIGGTCQKAKKKRESHEKFLTNKKNKFHLTIPTKKVSHLKKNPLSLYRYVTKSGFIQNRKIRKNRDFFVQSKTSRSRPYREGVTISANSEFGIRIPSKSEFASHWTKKSARTDESVFSRARIHLTASPPNRYSPADVFHAFSVPPSRGLHLRNICTPRGLSKQGISTAASKQICHSWPVRIENCTADGWKVRTNDHQRDNFRETNCDREWEEILREELAGSGVFEFLKHDLNTWRRGDSYWRKYVT